MAIIRLDCNLNGGDSVTPNNELFYRIYGDVDAYASPIHATGTALSDANVTVDNDRVIITGVDGTTNNGFKIAAVDGAGNEGILSDAVSGLTILFEDDFSGTIAKWTVKNDANVDVGIISQRYTSNATTLTNVDLENNNSVGNVDFNTDVGGTYYMAFNIEFPALTTVNGFHIGIADALIQNGIIISRTSIASTVDMYEYVDGSATKIGTSITGGDPYGLPQDYKIAINSTGKTVEAFYWNGSAWVSGTSGVYTFTSTALPFIIASSAGTSVSINYVDDVVVTTGDFATLRP